MIPVDEFRQENLAISQLCAVLNPLLSKDELLTNPIVCELLERFSKKVEAHLDHEARSLYGDLLRKKGGTGGQVAAEFIENTHELKRILNKHNKHWCKGLTADSDFGAFRKQTSEIFHLVGQRIDMEEKKLFPVLSRP